jgi:hypothetical protein
MNDFALLSTGWMNLILMVDQLNELIISGFIFIILFCNYE